MSDTDTAQSVDEPHFHRLTVKALHEETAEARSFVLSAERADKASFRYQPGQFLSFRIPHADGQITRCYSLSSAPGTDPEMTICVKRVRDGRGSNWLHEHLSVGARIEATRPSGRFVLHVSDAPVLLIAGGSGITPCLALIKQVLSETDRRVKLVYANPNQESVIYHESLSRLEKRFAERFVCRHWLDDERGYLRAADVESETEGWTDAEFYICGPTPLMELAEDTLDTLLGPKVRILSERFSSQIDESTIEYEASDLISDSFVSSSMIKSVEDRASQARVESFRLQLDGMEYEVPISAGETLLQAALGAGIDAPFSCTEGHCGMCMVKLCSGQVQMSSTRALSKRNIANGLVLACQSTPDSADQILLNFDF